MTEVVLLLALAHVMWSGAAEAARRSSQGGDSALAVRVVRFYSPGTGSTLVEGIAEVRPSALGAPAGVARYRVEVAVQDSTGMELHRSGWSREVPAQVAATAGVSVMESFQFALAPGRYRVAVRVVPAEGRPTAEREVAVIAFEARPLVSDMLLATAAREVESDSGLMPGEVRRGSLALHTAPVPHLTFAAASLTYYTEIYPWAGAGAGAALRLEVATAEGRRVVGVAPQQLSVGPLGAVARGTLDLAGLPRGSYQLRASLTMGESTAVVTGPFTMGPPRGETTAARGPAARPAGPFDGVGEVTLDSLYAPLVYLQREDERGVYENLTVEGKRRYLAEFWRRRDPTPATPDNPRMDEFYRGVRYANQAFREGGAGQIPGWRTDRGRIFLKYGQPNDALRRPEAHPRPFEVWLYSRERPLYFVFWDQTGFGHYVLLGTNDRFETEADPNWESRLGEDNAREILGFIQR